MQISELSARTGVPVATLKFYLRERLLMPGVVLSATRADYGEEHVRRVGVVRALTDVVGISVQQAREIFRLFDSPPSDLFDSLGQAIGQLPPRSAPTADDYPRARAVLERLGWMYDPRYAAVPQLEQALAGAESAGLPLSDERLAAYAPAIRQIAEYDIAQVPADPGRAIEYSVLGTALYEPVIVALRRLAHQDAAAARLAPTTVTPTAERSTRSATPPE
jgi:DNA-binding transcriptional MerR regulator